MNQRKNKGLILSGIIFSISLLGIVFVIYIHTRIFGPLDTYPRTQQVIVSSDGIWEFEVFHRKLKPLNPFSDYEIVFKIKNNETNRVSEQRMWRVSRLTGFGQGRNYNVRFERDVIIVDDFWVANKTTLKFEMCPFLECLKKPN